MKRTAEVSGGGYCEGAFVLTNLVFMLLVAVLALTTSNTVAAQTLPAPKATPAAQPATGPSYGDNDPCTSLSAIVTRPSVTTSVCTVRPNHVLIETGYQNTTADATSTSVQYPQALVRVGTHIPALEIDLGLPIYERLTAANTTTSGTTDIGAGVKYVLGYSSRFNFGTSAYFTAATGSNGFSAGATQAYNLNFGYTIDPLIALSGTLGFNALSAGATRYDSFVPSLVLSLAVSHTTGAFLESALFTHGAGPQTPTRTQLLGGVTQAVSPRLQIDLEAGRSPTTTTGKYRFVGFGASYYL